MCDGHTQQDDPLFNDFIELTPPFLLHFFLLHPARQHHQSPGDYTARQTFFKKNSRSILKEQNIFHFFNISINEHDFSRSSMLDRMFFKNLCNQYSNKYWLWTSPRTMGTTKVSDGSSGSRSARRWRKEKTITWEISAQTISIVFWSSQHLSLPRGPF